MDDQACPEALTAQTPGVRTLQCIRYLVCHGHGMLSSACIKQVACKAGKTTHVSAGPSGLCRTVCKSRYCMLQVLMHVLILLEIIINEAGHSCLQLTFRVYTSLCCSRHQTSCTLLKHTQVLTILTAPVEGAYQWINKPSSVQDGWSLIYLAQVTVS